MSTAPQKTAGLLTSQAAFAHPVISLHGISPILGIGLGHIHLFVLGLAVFEEIYRHLREQRVGKHILVLLLPLFHLLFDLRQLVGDQVRRTVNTAWVPTIWEEGVTRGGSPKSLRTLGIS